MHFNDPTDLSAASLVNRCWESLSSKMRIGCLQFAPQVGDIDNNLNRADAVLSKANPEDLDILVLPELAFTGMLRNHLFLLYIALSKQFRSDTKLSG